MNVRSMLSRLGSSRPKADGSSPWREDVEVIAEHGLFDADYYLAKYPDVAASGIDPLEHYARYGVSEGRNPSSSFDTNYYLASNPDVRQARFNPLVHYALFGRKEGRAASALPSVSSPSSSFVASSGERDLLTASGLFDREWYSRAYMDGAGLEDPLDHYLRVGRYRGCRPNRYFDGQYYLERYADVAQSGMDPFRHYCEYGWKELRSPSPNVDAEWYWVVYMGCSDRYSTLAHLAKHGEPPEGVSPTLPLTRAQKIRISGVVRELLDKGKVGSHSLAFLARYLEKVAVWDAAELVLRRLLVDDLDEPTHYLALGRVLSRQNKSWQKVEVMTSALERMPNEVSIWNELGEAHLRMRQWEAAAKAFERSAELKPENSDAHYFHGLALERSGYKDESKLAYERACDSSSLKGVARIGVARLHQVKGHWVEAAKNLRARLEECPADAELHFHHAVALDRCYEWELAASAYKVAIGISSEGGPPYWHYRLGHVLERLGDFKAAASSYRWAAERAPAHNSYWFFRLGYALAAAGEFEEACVAYEQVSASPVAQDSCGSDSYTAMLHSAAVEHLRAVLERDFQSAQVHAQLASCLRSQGDLRGAAASYARAIDCSDEHVRAWHYALGSVLSALGRYQEACDAYAGCYTLRRPFNVQLPQADGSASAASMEYVELLETTRLRQKVILFDSYNGASVSGNPLAIFRRMLKSPRFADWLYVWAVKDRSLVPEEYRGAKNVVFILRGSYAYRKFVATASHIVSNTTLPPWFIRREGQRYLNTWHGTPLKTLGRDMRGRFLEHKTFSRNLLHATHVISPNRHTTDVLLKRHELATQCPPKVAETGYPRIDSMLNLSARRAAELRKRLGLDTSRGVVLYAPTWRGVHGAVHIDTERLVRDVERLRDAGVQLIFRGHALVESVIGKVGDIPVVPADIDTNELLGIVDLLITDYSSIFFDYLPSKRPIIYYAYDEESYRAERGLYFNLDEMPGRVCRDIDSVVAAMGDMLSLGAVNDPRMLRALQAFCPHEDGAAADRVISFFVDDDDSCLVERPVSNRTAVLLFGGDFVSNGITSSLLNLMRCVDTKAMDFVVALDHGNVDPYPERVRRVQELPEEVQLVARFGAMGVDPDEKWLLDQFNRHGSVPSERAWASLASAYQREFRRMFGALKFDAHVQFEGFLPFWVALFACGGDPARRLVFLHSDMYAEFSTRFPHLEGVFNLYRNYDAMVCVSERMAAVNASSIAGPYRADAGRFTYCSNAIDVRGIKARSQDPIPPDMRGWFRGGHVFISMGRLSPEKDHVKLIRAFKYVHAERPDSKLIIVGDGPSFHDVRSLVAELGLGEAVLLAGLHANPFPLLAGADCLVLSSNHEGQPMVLLEAMVLGKSIVATDIPGSRAVLEDVGGLLVSNSVDGLREGMLKVIGGYDAVARLDLDAYGESVAARFSRLVSNA